MTAPTSDGSHLNELPLNSDTSIVSPFFITDHLYRQGIVAISELLVYVVRVNVVLESINYGELLTKKLYLPKSLRFFDVLFLIQSNIVTFPFSLFGVYNKKIFTNCKKHQINSYINLTN